MLQQNGLNFVFIKRKLQQIFARLSAALKVRLERGEESRSLAAGDRPVVESGGKRQHAPHRGSAVLDNDAFLASSGTGNRHLRRYDHVAARNVRSVSFAEYLGQA
jgi:hypothetical protein